MPKAVSKPSPLALTGVKMLKRTPARKAVVKSGTEMKIKNASSSAKTSKKNGGKQHGGTPSSAAKQMKNTHRRSNPTNQSSISTAKNKDVAKPVSPFETSNSASLDSVLKNLEKHHLHGGQGSSSKCGTPAPVLDSSSSIRTLHFTEKSYMVIVPKAKLPNFLHLREDGKNTPLYDAFWQDAKPAERDTIVMYNREVKIPRYIKLYGKEKDNICVSVSGQTWPANPIREEGTSNKAVPVDQHQDQTNFVENHLKKVLDFFNEKLQPVKRDKQKDWNAILINWYTDGQDYIGFHADREKSIDHSLPILTLSYGAERKFQVQTKVSKVKKENKPVMLFDEVIPENSLVIMGGDFQTELKHSVPKMKNVDGKRMSFTIRRYHPNP
ncbi:unnamed protein product [Amoebophrya sp. A120]|nr:unnamed protein product [Amoebophrya sp. A120]|eukprot:GSA120T00010142001.1